MSNQSHQFAISVLGKINKGGGEGGTMKLYSIVYYKDLSVSEINLVSK